MAARRTGSDAFPGGRWHGHWIAADVPEFAVDPTSLGGDLLPARFSRVQFRRTFQVATGAAVPARVPLRVSADSRYVLWVNDVEVGRGPIRSQPRRLRYDTYDIAELVRPGSPCRRSRQWVSSGRLPNLDGARRIVLTPDPVMGTPSRRVR